MCLTHIIVNSPLILYYNWAPLLMYLFKTMTHGENMRNTSLAPEIVDLISTTFHKTLYAEMVSCLSSTVVARDKISYANFINKVSHKTKALQISRFHLLVTSTFTRQK